MAYHARSSNSSTPRLFHPTALYVSAMLLLTFAAGMTVAGLGEARLAGDQLWVILFAVGLIGTLILYSRVTVDLLTWLDGYEPVCSGTCQEVCCRDF